MRSLARLTLLALAIVILLVCFYWPWLSGRASFYVLDFAANWQPILTYIGDRLRQRELPLWNPYVCNGVPQFFFPSIAYPINWLFGVFDFNRAMAAAALVQQLIAGVGMFLLVDSLGWGTAAAAFAAMLLAFSGALFSAHIDYVLQGSFAFFPLTLWSLRKIESDSTLFSMPMIITTALAIFLMITADMPEIFIPALLILGCYSLVAWWHDRDDIGTTVLSARIGALVCGAMLSAPLLIPLLEWLRLSARASGLQPAIVFANSMSWYDLLCIVLPQPLGDFYTTNKFEPMLTDLYMPDKSVAFAKLIFSTYIGPAAATLAVWGACDRRWRWGKWVLLLLGIAILVGFGAHSPLVVKVVELSHIAWFRNPIKCVPWITFSLVLLAARGFVMLAEGERTNVARPTLVGWCALSAISTLLVTITADGAATPGLPPPNSMHGQALAAIAGAVIGSSMLGIATCLLYILRANKKLPGNAALIAVAAMTVACLMANAWQFNFHPGPPDFYSSKIALANRLKALTTNSTMIRLANIVVTPFPTKSMDFTFPAAPAYYKRQMLYPLSGLQSGIASVNYWINGQTADNRKLWQLAIEQYNQASDSLLATVCRMSSTDFLLTLSKAPDARGELVAIRPPDARFFQPVFTDEQLNISAYRVVQPLPRAYIAGHVQWGRPHESVIDFISKGAFDPLKLTILEHNDPRDTGPMQSETPPASRVTIVGDAPEHVTLRCNMGHAGFVILTDEFYPGWHGSVDGNECALYRANGIFRAVYCPAGTHSIDFYYLPGSLLLGAAMAVATACSLLIGWLCLSKRKAS